MNDNFPYAIATLKLERAILNQIIEFNKKELLLDTTNIEIEDELHIYYSKLEEIDYVISLLQGNNEALKMFFKKIDN